MKLAVILLAVIALSALVVACRAKKVDKSLATYSGEVRAYKGSKKLVVAFTASWASFWKITEQELAKIDKSRFDLCILDADADRDQVGQFSVDFLPTVALVEDGKITKRVQNLASIDQIQDW